VRAARAHGHAKALGGAHGNVGTEFAGGYQQREGQQVGRHDDHAAFGFVGL